MATGHDHGPQAPDTLCVDLPAPADTDALGARLAAALVAVDTGLAVSLAGELGAGKTALARAVLHALGHTGPVVSPSYTLVEPYALAARTIYHVDLYRLAEPGELDYLGLREIDTARDWLFVEWARHGEGYLPAPDVELVLEYADSGRGARITAYSGRGRRLVDRLKNAR